MKDRETLLRSLLALDRPLEEIRSGLSLLGWDSSDDLAFFTKDHALSILRRFLGRSLSANKVEEWANAIEGREDIGFESRYESILRDLIHELANPLLTRPLTYSSATEWVAHLEGRV